MSLAANGARPPGAQAGLSLVELIVAMALGLLLTLGAVQAFLGSNQTYRLSDGLAKLQENMRFALDNFQYEGRLAGHQGCLVGEPVNDLDKTHAAYEPIAYDGQAVIGWDSAGTGLGDVSDAETLTVPGGTWKNSVYGGGLPDDLADRVIRGNDVLVVNRAELIDTTVDGAGAGTANLPTVEPSGIAQDSVVLVIMGDCSAGEIFQKTNAGNGATITKAGNTRPGNASPQIIGSYDSNATVYLYTSTAYYIGVGADNEPALFRDRLDAGDPFGAVELASGVENMQVLYGIAGEGGKRALGYVPASAVIDWADVVSIRIALLMRSADRITDVSEARIFNLTGTRIKTAADRRARLVGFVTVGIRNRLD